MGSPTFAIPSLRVLSENFELVGIVTQPDRQAGRGRILSSPPVKELAIKLDIPYIQPDRLKDEDATQRVHEWRPDVIVVAAFGQILRPQILRLPPYGCINVHASLLPRWRGAAPIPASILHGDKETGITIIQMDAGIDSGPILSQRKISIETDDNSATLSKKLSKLGAELLMETLPSYLNGKLTPMPQDENLATFAPMLTKEDGKLDFNQSAQQLDLMVRAFNPWPGAYTYWKNQRLSIYCAHAHPLPPGIEIIPGATLVERNLPAIMTRAGILILDEIQLSGRKRMSGQAFLLGARHWGNDILTG